MPFSMIHLSIALNIIDKTPEIKHASDFILGAIAPDAVHNRANYHSDMKRKSHLCVGDEPWGRATNNSEWMRNVLKFVDEVPSSEHRDFMLGYASHIIADIQNNIKIWTPFRLENEENLRNGLGSTYHKESFDIDSVLFHREPTQRIFDLLKHGKAYGISDFAFQNEIEQLKEDVLTSWYKSREVVDVSTHRYVTLETIDKFIEEESDYIKRLLIKP